MAFGFWTRMGVKKYVIDGVQITHVKSKFLEETRPTCPDPGHTRQHPTVSCGKMTEPIDMPFGLWTRMGGRRHGRHIGATWWIRFGNRTHRIKWWILPGSSQTVISVGPIYAVKYRQNRPKSCQIAKPSTLLHATRTGSRNISICFRKSRSLL